MVDKSPGFILKTPKVKEDLKQWRTKPQTNGKGNPRTHSGSLGYNTSKRGPSKGILRLDIG